MRSLLRVGVAFGRALGVAFAADTVSITVMEIVDNLVVLAIPGAMDAGLGDCALLGLARPRARDRLVSPRSRSTSG